MIRRYTLLAVAAFGLLLSMQCPSWAQNVPEPATKTLPLVSPVFGDSTAAASVKSMPDDFRISITDASGKAAYPISSFTYLLIPTQWQDQAKKNAIVTFLNWMLDQGQSSVEQLNYAPLPKLVVQKEKARVKEIH